MKIFKKITMVSILLLIMLTYIQTLVFATLVPAVESELTLTPKPETNNIHLKWTGPQNSSYKVYQKKPGSNHFETIGLTDFNNADEEVKVLNVYPTRESIVQEVLRTEQPESQLIPDISVTYLDRN